MKKQNLKRIICTALALGVTCSFGLTSAQEQQQFDLDPVVVTALRSESKDLETPAYVHVYNEDQLKDTGARNLLDALQFTEGITYDGYGASGHLYSSMTAKATIRGMDRGTVVLVNGVPTNMSGYYALERIPLDNIEKVEIVKGSSSVLYGSSAMGGVINIITKDKVQNSITLEQGSYERNSQAISLQLDDVSISASHKEQGDMGQISDPYSGKYSAFRGDKRDSVRWSWKINENMTLTHQHDVDDFKFDRMTEKGAIDDLYEHIDQKETKDYVSLKINHNSNWKTTLYGNILDRDYKKHNSTSKLTADKLDTFKNLGMDNQKSWTTPYGQYIAGFSWQNESYESDDKLTDLNDISSKERNSYSLFTQLTHPLSANRDLILGARQEFIEQKGAKDYAEFCPQMQIITRISPEQSWYINTGRAFRMPNQSDMYGSTWRKTANPNLDPEHGYNYEIGWKKATDDHSLKVALYHMDFTNYIQWKKITDGAGNDTYVPYNTEFRNTGLEISYDKKVNTNLSYKLGCSISNPEEQAEGEDWKLAFARLQLTGGFNYQQDKWSANLTASYLGQRKDNVKPTLPVNLVLGYQASEVTKLQFGVENLFDRDDIVSHGSSHYHATPRNYNFSVTTKF